MEGSNSKPAASSQTQACERGRAWGRIAPWIPAALIAIALFVLSSTPGTQFPTVKIWGADKVVHAVLYGTLAVTLAMPLSRLRLSAQPFKFVLTACFIAVLYGVLDECNQAFIPFRTPSVADVIADAVGALCGSLLFVFWRQRRARRRVSRASHEP